MERGEMETRPVDRIEDSRSGETPESAAIPDSWAKLRDAKYLDSSAEHRAYRAQMRHRAAELLRLVELKAQSEAEAAAAEAEAVRAKAEAATLSVDSSRNKPGIGPQATQEEEEVEYRRRSSLLDSTQHAERAAAEERLQAARRAEAAALTDSIARRQERELAEAEVLALRRAAQIAACDPRSGADDAAVREGGPGENSRPLFGTNPGGRQGLRDIGRTHSGS